MIIKSPSPFGIDISIQNFQKRLHDALITEWGLDGDSMIDYLCYDRCYRNQRKDGFIPEVYSLNGEYKEVLIDDKVKVLSFFGIGSTSNYIKDEHLNESTVHLLFFVNLKALKSVTTRPDELIRQEIQSLCEAEFNGMELTSIQIGIDNILTEYTGADKLIKFRDMNPFHCFRLNFNLTYDYTDHICT
jgi:hypothetical protein